MHNLKKICKTHKPACLYLHTCTVCIAHYGNHAPLHKQLGAGIRGEIRPCWHGSFNEGLSRKSRSGAAFILCHFSNNVCRLVCVPAHLFVCRETGVFSRFFFFFPSSAHMPLHACMALGCQWDSWCSSKKLQSSMTPPPPNPSFVFDDLWVHIFVCFFSVLALLHYLDSRFTDHPVFFILFHPLCCHTLYRTIVSLPGVLHSPPFNLTSPGCVWRTWQFLCSSF